MAQKRIFAPKEQTLIKLLRFRQSLIGLKSKDSGKVHPKELLAKISYFYKNNLEGSI